MHVGSVGWKKTRTRRAGPGNRKLQRALTTESEAICVQSRAVQLPLDNNRKKGSARANTWDTEEVLKRKGVLSFVLSFLRCISSSHNHTHLPEVTGNTFPRNTSFTSVSTSTPLGFSKTCSRETDNHWNCLSLLVLGCSLPHVKAWQTLVFTVTTGSPGAKHTFNVC